MVAGTIPDCQINAPSWARFSAKQEDPNHPWNSNFKHQNSAHTSLDRQQPMHDQKQYHTPRPNSLPGSLHHTYTKRHDPRQSPHLFCSRTRRNATHLAVVRETLCHAASPDYEIAPTDRGRISLSQQPRRLQGETRLNQAQAPTASTPQRLLGSLGVEIISISIIPGGRRGRHWILRRPKLDSFGSAHRPGSPPGSNDTRAHSRKNSWLRRSSFQKVPYLIKRPLPVPTQTDQEQRSLLGRKFLKLPSGFDTEALRSRKRFPGDMNPISMEQLA